MTRTADHAKEAATRILSCPITRGKDDEECTCRDGDPALVAQAYLTLLQQQGAPAS